MGEVMCQCIVNVVLKHSPRALHCNRKCKHKGINLHAHYANMAIGSTSYSNVIVMSPLQDIAGGARYVGTISTCLFQSFSSYDTTV